MEMPPDFVERLKTIREEAQKRLEAAQADIKAIDRVLALNEKSLPRASNEEIRVAAIGILIAAGVSMHRKDILATMEATGIYVSGQDPAATLGAILSRNSSDFESQGNGIWGLKRTRTVDDTLGFPQVLCASCGRQLVLQDGEMCESCLVAEHERPPVSLITFAEDDDLPF